MVPRALLAAGVLTALMACGGQNERDAEVRLLAPPGLVSGTAEFERQTGCRVDLRVYDEEENLAAIARRRDVDVLARPARPGETPHASTDLVRITLADGLEIVVPKSAAAAYGRPARPAGRREIRWAIRREGANPRCARRWLAYVSRSSR